MKTITFVKEVSTPTASTEALIVIKTGVNPKGLTYRSLNQINTANSFIDDARDSFESFEITLEEMVSIIKTQGFKLR